MDDHQGTTPRGERGRNQIRSHRRRARAAYLRARDHMGAASAEAGVARDGGRTLTPLAEPETLTSHDEGGVRRGPYEVSYIISQGYFDE